MPQLPFEFHATDEADTDRLGAALADVLPDAAVVALIGPLGAGKTRLVRAVAVAAGVAPHDVVSPTFVLVSQYVGQRTIHHFDAYRLRDDDEFLQLGAEETFESGGVTFVEWGERVRDCLPADRFEIQIEATGETARTFTVSSPGGEGDAVIQRLSAALRA